MLPCIEVEGVFKSIFASCNSEGLPFAQSFKERIQRQRQLSILIHVSSLLICIFFAGLSKVVKGIHLECFLCSNFGHHTRCCGTASSFTLCIPWLTDYLDD